MGLPTSPHPALISGKAIHTRQLASNISNDPSHVVNPTVRAISRHRGDANQLRPIITGGQGGASLYDQSFDYPHPSPTALLVGYSPGDGQANYNLLASEAPSPQGPDVITTRSGRGIPKRSTVPKPRKPRPRAREKRSNTKGLTEKQKQDMKRFENVPLSTLPELPWPKAIEIITAFVNRPAETRFEEYLKAGKINRPLNKFMLYRKIYVKTAQDRLLEPQHQQLSTIVGRSWRWYESKSVQDTFQRLAQIDSENHMKIFPNYKFAPSKPQKQERERGLPASSISEKRTSKTAGPRTVAAPARAQLRERRGGGISWRREHVPSTALDEKLPKGNENHQVEEISPLLAVEGEANEQQAYKPSYAWAHTPDPYGHGLYSYHAEEIGSESQFGPLGDQAVGRASSPDPYLGHSHSGPVDNGLGNFAGHFVDQPLVSGAHGLPYGDLAYCTPSMHAQDTWLGEVDFGPNMPVMLPDLAVGGAHTAYLSKDWESFHIDEQLDDGNRDIYDDWVGQTERGDA